jgi:hypothetical protein
MLVVMLQGARAVSRRGERRDKGQQKVEGRSSERAEVRTRGGARPAALERWLGCAVEASASRWPA